MHAKLWTTQKLDMHTESKRFKWRPNESSVFWKSFMVPVPVLLEFSEIVNFIVYYSEDHFNDWKSVQQCKGCWISNFDIDQPWSFVNLEEFCFWAMRISIETWKLEVVDYVGRKLLAWSVWKKKYIYGHWSSSRNGCFVTALRAGAWPSLSPEHLAAAQRTMGKLEGPGRNSFSQLK